MIKIVFLDRDGVINVNIPKGYVTSPSQMTILPNAGSAIRRLNDGGILVVLISNQQGVSRGLMSQGDLDDVDAAMRSAIRDSDGAEIARSYYCTHLSTESCECRKPRGGQLLTAAAEFGVDLSEAIFIGDSPTDIQAGKHAGVGHNALVLSGATKSWTAGVWPSDPDSIHLNLAVSVEWILSQHTAQGKTDSL